MGKSSKPLKIITFFPCNGWDEFTALAAQGHDIIAFPDITDWETADLIIGERCWHLTELHRKYLPLAIAAARARRYPKEAKHE